MNIDNKALLVIFGRSNNIMKKKLFSIIAAFVALFAIGSCSDDIESSLDGTVWVVEFSDYHSDDEYSELKFFEREAYETDYRNELIVSKVRYAYDYDYPTVMLYPDDDEIAVLKGIISGDEMSVVNMSNGKYIWTLTRTK